VDKLPRDLATGSMSDRAVERMTKPGENQRASGQHYPLGAHWDGRGVNFALFSAHAEKVELCLFDPQGGREIERIGLEDKTDQVWHGHVAGLEPGTCYGYRVHGPYEPAHGHRFNPAKLLMDPYARMVDRELICGDAHLAFPLGSPGQDLEIDRRDNADSVPKCVVTSNLFDWRDDRPPAIPWSETVVYECHIGSMTRLHPAVPEVARGRYAGLSHPSVIEHLQRLGITTVELMPVQGFADEAFLRQKGLRNHWGYSPLNYFAPERRYAHVSAIDEFKSMVRALHAAGLEVILDVVYNHTFEGSHVGPTLSWRGIDNASYYRLQNRDARYYIDDTGCGNTLNLSHPRVLQMVMDSLRYWVQEMHVDGFRFDLGTTLGRETYGFDRGSGFFDAVRQDPVLSTVKLIAEPWDVGPGGYQLGGFPTGWSEWNDRYRDTVRRFWRGDDGMLADLARRLHGSSDLFEHSGRGPWASINFVTSHDGFTLTDLVSYAQRDNTLNGEDNRDGHHANFSLNHGVDGPTDDPAIRNRRLRHRRNLMATLLLSQGTPMLLAGDELGRSQGGNNNAYCQDNEISWLDWTRLQSEQDWLAFVQRLIQIRKQHPVLRRSHFVHGQNRSRLAQLADIQWIDRDGGSMQDHQWLAGSRRFIGMMLCEDDEAPNPGGGGCVVPEVLLLYFHADGDAIDCRLPDPGGSSRWTCLLDTAAEGLLPDTASSEKAGGSVFVLPERTVQVWRMSDTRAQEPVAGIESI